MNLSLETAFAHAVARGWTSSERTFRRAVHGSALVPVAYPKRPKVYPLAEWQRLFDLLGLGDLPTGKTPRLSVVGGRGRVVSTGAVRRAAKERAAH